MNRFEKVVEILDESIGGPEAGFGGHGPFWRGLTRDEFVAATVAGIDLLVVGDGGSSNLVRALRGESPFGSNLADPPPDADMPRMPFGFSPIAEDQIGFIQRWIDDRCPEDAFPAAPALTWRPTNAPNTRRYDDIWFVTPELGWAVNSDGKILHTTDGGDTWTEQFHVTGSQNRNVWLRCIGFANESRGWVGTTSGPKRLFDTEDGGATWRAVTNLPANAPAAVCGLSVVSESVVYASGTNFPFPADTAVPPRVMKTVDGGRTWEARDMSDHAALLVDTFFLSAEEGWVVGGKVHEVTAGQPRCMLQASRSDIKPVVLHTSDGGSTWTNQVADIEDQFSLGEWGWKIFFVDDQLGFVSLENFCEGAYLKTTDGGQTWQRLAINDAQHNSNLEGVGFADESHGWVGGWGPGDMTKGSSSATTDGGHSWVEIDWGEPITGEFLNRFRFFGSPVTVGYASGNTVYKYSADPVPVVHGAVASVEPSIFTDSAPAPSPRPVRLDIVIPDGGSQVSIDVFSRFGAQVRQLVDETLPMPGERSVQWDVNDDAGAPLQDGYYIVRVIVDDLADSKIVLVTS